MAESGIDLSSPDIGPDERRLVDEVLRSGRLSMGPMIGAFEHEFATRTGTRHAIAVSSGTAGLHLALIAAGLSEGDLVLTTPFSFVATANVVLYERATPVFVDIDPESLEMDVDRALSAIDALTKRKSGGTSAVVPRRGGTDGRLRAVLPVHIFGRTASPETTRAALSRDIRVIEDACEAVGATLDGQATGSLGDAGVFGFYPNKQITTGEGGVVVTDDDSMASAIRSLRNHGRGVGGDDPELHLRLGFNYRLDEMSAALGLAQLRRLDEILEARRLVAERYTQCLSGSPFLEPLAAPPPGNVKSWFVYVVRLDESVDRTLLIERMAARGISSRAYFHPIHLQPYYRKRFGYQPGDFPVAEAAGRSMLALPFHTRLASDDVDRVCSVLEEEAAHSRPAMQKRIHL